MPARGRTTHASGPTSTSSISRARSGRLLGRRALSGAKCLFTGIATDLEVLRTSNNDQAKLNSLKFLGHWVGDIHQPLHVSFADDRGGNFIRESGPCVNSLHTVWDTCIIEKKLGTDPQTVATDLLDGLSETDKSAWLAIPVEGAANASFQV